MRAQDIVQLGTWLAATDIDTLELNGPEGHVRLEKNRTATRPVPVTPTATATTTPATPATATATSASLEIRATTPGLWLDRWPGRTEPLVHVGALVQPGDLMGLLQVGPLLLPVRAVQAGRLRGWQATPGQAVDYGYLLGSLDPLHGSASAAV